LSKKCGSLDVSLPYRPSPPVTGIASLFFYPTYEPKNFKDPLEISGYSTNNKTPCNLSSTEETSSEVIQQFGFPVFHDNK
jgi:hypothetical protein